MPLTNPWIGYAQRSYLAIKQAIITKLADPVIGVPEITDYSDTNPFIKKVSIWSALTEQMGYFIDEKGREVFLISQRLYRSAVLLSQQYDYRIRGVIPATGTATFTISAPAATDITIPNGTEVQTSDAVKYLTTSPGTIVAGQTQVTVDIKQWEKIGPLTWGTASGAASFTIPLTSDVVDDSISVLVNNTDNYTPVDSWIDTLATDRHFKAGMNVDYVMAVEFGDGITGTVPATGASIQLTYYRSLGTFGKVPSGAIDTINSTLTLPPGTLISVSNASETTGAADPEALAELKKFVPLSLRTLWRAVTDTDFEKVAELAPGVARAGQSFQCGMNVDIYIAPNGGGNASPSLITSTRQFMMRRSIIGRNIAVYSAGEVQIVYNIDVWAKPTFFAADVLADVQQVLLDFHSIQNQRIRGTVNISDIYFIVDNLEKVDHSVINSMIAQPYARPLTTSTPTLVWTKTLNPGVVNRTFRIIFQNGTTYKLLRDNVFMGNFNTGQAVSLTELDFTVNGGPYAANNSWEFRTYTPGNAVALTEPSLPTTSLPNLFINVIGGA